MHSVEECHVGKDTGIIDLWGSNKNVTKEAGEAISDHLGRDEKEYSPSRIHLLAIV